MEGMTGNQKVDNFLSILGALVPLFSALASFLNHMVRVQSAEGKTPSSVLLGAGSVLNVASINIDKGVQLAKMAMGGTPPQTAAQEPKTE